MSKEFGFNDPLIHDWLTAGVLIEHEGGQAFTTSIKVADLYELEHAEVMERIEALGRELGSIKFTGLEDMAYGDCPEVENEKPFFDRVPYVDENGATTEACKISRNGFALLSSTMTGRTRTNIKRLELTCYLLDAFSRTEHALLAQKGAQDGE